ncbi:siphovirus Gp157 family protein [Corticibacterium sp. UT-5YL-CI-8]|nr:siphovirus Gp157 family protein [Tianweitania sp. UT-5YL-CI-8]
MKTDFLQADVANVLADIDSLFAAYPELAEDESLRADMLEGSTSAFDVLSRLVTIERDADSMGRAIAARVSDLNARKARAERRKEAMRTLMLRVMRAADIKKAPLVEATISISKGRDSVEITDEAALADEFVKIERIPDKKAILDIVKGCGEIPGARLKQGDDTLTVRVA